jgi:6-phosphogluconolactonase
MNTSHLLAIMFAASALFPASMLFKMPNANAAESSPDHPQTYLVYVGTFTNKESKGLYVMRFDATTGTLTQPELAIEGISPSFLALHPNHRFIYSVNEVDSVNGEPHGGVSAFSINPQSGKLKLLNTQPSAGQSPTHIVVDSQGKNALVANYTTGSVAVLPIDSQGKLAHPS